jgi:hypothetical protein
VTWRCRSIASPKTRSCGSAASTPAPCVNTGTYFKLALTEAQHGTFVDGEAGMEPATLQTRVFDVVAGKRYFRSWMRQTLDALDRAACQGPASEKAV